jgi:hypothetical protein
MRKLRTKLHLENSGHFGRFLPELLRPSQRIFRKLDKRKQSKGYTWLISKKSNYP